MDRGSAAVCGLAIVVALSVTAGAEERDPSRVIAQIGDRRITFGEIGCNRKVVELNRQRLGGRSIDAACAEAEQQEFRSRAASALIEAACVVERCVLTEAEIDRFRSPVLKDEHSLRSFAREARRVPEAIRRVYRGESIDAVYEDVIRPLNIPLESFRNEVAMYGTLERVEKYLARDFVETLRQQLEDRARRKAMLAQLRGKIEALAASGKRSRDASADDYLASLQPRLTVLVFDNRFQIPKGREVFQ